MADAPVRAEEDGRPPATGSVAGARRRRVPLWFVAVVVLVGIRVLVCAGLVFGPWSDEPAEVAGWDVARFQAIVDEPGRAYRDHEVEYPPGFVAVLEVVAADDTVATTRRLAVVALVVDLAVAAVLARGWNSRAALAWLVLGLPLVLGTYQRLDVLSVLCAVGALAAARRRWPTAAGALVAAGVLVKTWPILLLGALVRPGRRRGLVVAVVLLAIAGLTWVAVGGSGAPGQVLGFRGATGWHVESTPGLILGLWSGARAQVESGSYRLGHASAAWRGLFTAVAAVGYLLIWWRAGVVGRRRPRGPASAPSPQGSVDRVDALALLASVALLLVTAPLFSPQYVLWLLPWAAIAWGCGARLAPALVGVATVVTAVVLVIYTPAAVDRAVPELALLVRNLVLVGALAVAILELRRPEGPPAAPSEEPHGAGSPAGVGDAPRSVPGGRVTAQAIRAG